MELCLLSAKLHSSPLAEFATSKLRGHSVADKSTFDDAAKKALPNEEVQTPASKEILRVRLQQMIVYAVGRYDWYEDQRQKRLNLALAIGALSGATIPILFNKNLQEYFLSTLLFGVAVLALIVTAFYTIAIYLKGQGLSYTHRGGLATISSWYHYGLPKQDMPGVAQYLSDKVKSDLFLQEKYPTDEKEKTLSESYSRFVQKFNEMSKDDLNFIREDLQQVYILYILQGISRTNNRLMVSSLRCGINVVMVLVFFAICAFLVQYALFD